MIVYKLYQLVHVIRTQLLLIFCFCARVNLYLYLVWERICKRYCFITKMKSLLESTCIYMIVWLEWQSVVSCYFAMLCQYLQYKYVHALHWLVWAVIAMLSVRFHFCSITKFFLQLILSRHTYCSGVTVFHLLTFVFSKTNLCNIFNMLLLIMKW